MEVGDLSIDPDFRREAFHLAMAVLARREPGGQDVRQAVLLAECAADFLALSAEYGSRHLGPALDAAKVLWRRHGARRGQNWEMTEVVLQLASDTLDDVARIMCREQVVLH